MNYTLMFNFASGYLFSLTFEAAPSYRDVVKELKRILREDAHMFSNPAVEYMLKGTVLYALDLDPNHGLLPVESAYSNLRWGHINMHNSGTNEYLFKISYSKGEPVKNGNNNVSSLQGNIEKQGSKHSAALRLSKSGSSN